MKIIWSLDKIDYLKKNYDLKSAKELASYLGCSDRAIYLKAFKLGLKGRDPKIATKGLLRKFSESDVLFLKENYFILGPTKCSKILNKNRSGLVKLAKRLGLVRKNQFGSNNFRWKGGVSSIYERFRTLNRYWEWRYAVLDKGNSICSKCGSNKNLHVHHKISLKTLIDSYLKNNSLKIEDLEEKDLLNEYFYDLDNGQILCESCHVNFHRENGYKYRKNKELSEF